MSLYRLTVCNYEDDDVVVYTHAQNGLAATWRALELTGDDGKVEHLRGIPASLTRRGERRQVRAYADDGVWVDVELIG